MSGEAFRNGRTGVRPRWAGALLVALVVAAMVAGTASARPSPDRPPKPPHGRPSTTIVQRGPVPPDQAGPYRVGRETIEVSAADGSRTRTVDVWYPADPDATGDPSDYVFGPFPQLHFASDVALDGVPVAAGGPFPLVVYSHGSGGLRFVATFFTEVLASHGFVVVSADHTGDTVMDLLRGILPGDPPAVIASRAADVRLTVDAVLARAASPDDLLGGAVDPERIGITGHSYGGLTAFATVAGIAGAPDGGIPPDPRFRVIVSMDGTGSTISPEDLAPLDVPVLSIVGDAVGPGTSLWQYSNAHPLVQVRIDGAHHNEFTDVCLYHDLAPTIPDPPPVLLAYVNSLAVSCDPPYLPSDRVHQLTDWYAVAFLERYLAGDHRYARFLKIDPPGDRADHEVTDLPLLPLPDTDPLPPVDVTLPPVLD